MAGNHKQRSDPVFSVVFVSLKWVLFVRCRFSWELLVGWKSRFCCFRSHRLQSCVQCWDLASVMGISHQPLVAEV